MGRYWVLESVAFMDNGEPLFYRTIPKEPVEIDDEVAASLGSKVRPVESTVEDQSSEANETDDTAKTAEEPTEVEEPAPKPKRKRKAEEEPEEEPDGDTQV